MVRAGEAIVQMATECHTPTSTSDEGDEESPGSSWKKKRMIVKHAAQFSSEHDPYTI